MKINSSNTELVQSSHHGNPQRHNGSIVRPPDSLQPHARISALSATNSPLPPPTLRTERYAQKHSGPFCAAWIPERKGGQQTT
jgi:hypothetical protein